MPDRAKVRQGESLPEQALRGAVKHAMIDLDTTLKDECNKHDVSYDAAAKALSGSYQVANEDVQRLFQRLLHRWAPANFAPLDSEQRE